jgi:hypothetical protein
VRALGGGLSHLLGQSLAAGALLLVEPGEGDAAAGSTVELLELA